MVALLEGISCALGWLISQADDETKAEMKESAQQD